MVAQGEDGQELFIVLTGQVRIHSGETVLTRLGQGEHFGEMALVDKAPRSASVSADENSELLVIHRRDFFDVVRKDHDVAVKLLWSFLGVLTERLRSTSRELGAAREQLFGAFAPTTSESQYADALDGEPEPRDTFRPPSSED